jgi:DNA mismatch endonuclease (patch repair protein)
MSAQARTSRKKPGHRSWGARAQPVPGTHTGDTMSVATRSRVMARIRAKHTKPEIAFARLLEAKKIPFAQHVRGLPGRPDFVLYNSRIIIFVDGDFWHGWRFPLWQHKLSARWVHKISTTRSRDTRNRRRLRSAGWTVIRIWEHQLERDPLNCIARVVNRMRMLLGPPVPCARQ